MKRGTKITLWIVGVIVALVAFVELGLDVTISTIAEKQVRSAIEKANLPYKIDFGHVYFITSAACFVVDDVYFVNDTVAPDGTKEAVEVKVDRVTLDMGFWHNLYHKKQVSLYCLHVVRPEVSVWLSSDKKPTEQPAKQAVRQSVTETVDSLRHTNDSAAQQIHRWIERVCLANTEVRDAKLTLHQIESKMSVKVEDIDVNAYSFAYNFVDSAFSYCDSLYNLRIGEFYFIAPDGLVAIESHDIHTENAGEIVLGNTRVWHQVPKYELGKVVKEPASWIDLNLNQVVINPMNLMTTDFASGLHIEHVQVEASNMTVVRDNTHKPKKRFQMPQPVLMAMTYPFQIDRIDVNMERLDAEVMMTAKNIGSLQIQAVHAHLNDFNPAKGNVLEARMDAMLGKSKVHATYHMHMNRACQWDMEIRGKNLELGAINSMIKPLVAIEVQCHVDSVRAKYRGDRTKASGRFMLGYTGISAKVHKDIPISFEMISLNAGAIENFVNNLIPKSNPKYAGKPATAYQVEWEWDSAKEPYPLYVTMPVIMGAVQTFLPGLFSSKKIKPNMSIPTAPVGTTSTSKRRPINSTK